MSAPDYGEVATTDDLPQPDEAVIVASIHPQHSQAILDGTKTVELRRRLPKRDADWVLIHETAPTSMVVGHVEVYGVLTGPARFFWEQFAGRVGEVSEAEFHAYFDGMELAQGLLLFNPVRWSTPLPIDLLGLTRPPQSWGYVDVDRAAEAMVLGGGS